MPLCSPAATALGAQNTKAGFPFNGKSGFYFVLYSNMRKTRTGATSTRQIAQHPTAAPHLMREHKHILRRKPPIKHITAHVKTRKIGHAIYGVFGAPAHESSACRLCLS